MPVSKNDAPGSDGGRESTPKPEVAASPRPSSLVPASDSSDPRVHQLLAEREAALQNAGLTDDQKQRDEAREAALREVERIDEALSDLGVSAG